MKNKFYQQMALLPSDSDAKIILDLYNKAIEFSLLEEGIGMASVVMYSYANRLQISGKIKEAGHYYAKSLATYYCPLADIYYIEYLMEAGEPKNLIRHKIQALVENFKSENFCKFYEVTDPLFHVEKLKNLRENLENIELYKAQKNQGYLRSEFRY